MTIEAAIAVSRFGFGAQPGEIAKIGPDARGYLKAQLRRSNWLTAPGALPSAGGHLASLPGNIQQLPLDQKKELVRRAYLINYAEIAYRMAAGVRQQDSFRERLVWFWSNHFTASATNRQALAFLGAMEREAIRPHITGRFVDMLKAVTRHPAMLIYLDNVTNIGPHSRAGDFTGRGLNENLAREILELHTLGVDGGYTQADVTEFAKVLTGWSIPKTGESSETGFRYYPNRHEPGPKVVLGKTYEHGDGEREGIEVLEALARHPSTAKFIATKLARHFFGDQPNADTVARLAGAFRDTQGDLGALSAALIDDPAAWSSQAGKFRPPGEFVVAATRGVMPAMADQLLQLADDALAGKIAPRDAKGNTRQPTPGIALVESTRIMGQFPFTAPSPKGWSDDNSAWIAPDPILQRVEWCSQVGAKVPMQKAPTEIAQDLLADRLSGETRQAIELAASPAQGLALLLASPEFQRR